MNAITAAPKEVLRKFFRQKRNMFVKQNQANLTDQFYFKYSRMIADLLEQNNIGHNGSASQNRAINIGAFYPVKNEINCLSIINNLTSVARDYSFSLPVVPENGSKVLIFRQYNDEADLVQGAYKIPVPSENAPIVYPDALLVPMLCFNQNKYRLGYGGGFYDTTITALKEKKQNLLTIGIAFDIQETDDLPLEGHDMQLDYVLTENRLLH